MKNKSKRIVSAVTAFCLAGGIINTGITFPVKNSGVVFAEPDSSAESSTAVKRLRRQEVFVTGEVSVTNGIITLMNLNRLLYSFYKNSCLYEA